MRVRPSDRAGIDPKTPPIFGMQGGGYLRQPCRDFPLGYLCGVALELNPGGAADRQRAIRRPSRDPG